METRLHSPARLPPLTFSQRLPSRALDIEKKERSNLFPWRGQFSPQFVEALISAYAPSNGVVLDPFMGSGTVLAEASRLGHEVHGWEINPAAYIMARIYELGAFGQERRRGYLKDAGEIIRELLPGDTPLFRSAGHTAPRSLADQIAAAVHDPHVRSLLEAVLILADSQHPTSSQNVVWSKWVQLKLTVEQLPTVDRAVTANLGDARRLALGVRSVDFVLTSPPYINVFNYHHNFRGAVESLGWRPLVVARSEIGSNRKFRQNRFLTVIQYAIDIALMLRELQRVCRPGAAIILVVGRESNVLRTPFFNADIVAQVVMAIGGEIVLRQERSFQNRFGKRIVEVLIHLHFDGKSSKPESVVPSARRIGVACLSEARSRVAIEQKELLDEAIATSNHVQSSPLLNAAHARTSISPDGGRI